MNNLPQRKPTRLKGFDYSTPGAYFVTICTKNREKILCKIVGDDAHIVPTVQMMPIGMICDKYIKSISGIDKYVIMPNHIHMIIHIENGGAMKASPPTQSISQIIKSFKILVSKETGKPIFQRSFHDHIIRGEEDYNEIWNYIDTNVLKWERDCFYSKEDPIWG